MLWEGCEQSWPQSLLLSKMAVLPFIPWSCLCDELWAQVLFVRMPSANDQVGLAWCGVRWMKGPGVCEGKWRWKVAPPLRPAACWARLHWRAVPWCDGTFAWMGQVPWKKSSGAERLFLVHWTPIVRNLGLHTFHRTRKGVSYFGSSSK